LDSKFVVELRRVIAELWWVVIIMHEACCFVCV
jgi:hypothetical protein